MKIYLTEIYNQFQLPRGRKTYGINHHKMIIFGYSCDTQLFPNIILLFSIFDKYSVSSRNVLKYGMNDSEITVLLLLDSFM